jgi:hypothetical protein
LFSLDQTSSLNFAAADLGLKLLEWYAAICRVVSQASRDSLINRDDRTVTESGPLMPLPSEEEVVSARKRSVLSPTESRVQRRFKTIESPLEATPRTERRLLALRHVPRAHSSCEVIDLSKSTTSACLESFGYRSRRAKGQPLSLTVNIEDERRLDFILPGSVESLLPASSSRWPTTSTKTLWLSTLRRLL